ncbi:hypothetical protein IAT38_006315 [Cryptococcus sp. DSM 104549]
MSCTFALSAVVSFNSSNVLSTGEPDPLQVFWGTAGDPRRGSVQEGQGGGNARWASPSARAEMGSVKLEWVDEEGPGVKHTIKMIFKNPSEIYALRNIITPFFASQTASPRIPTAPSSSSSEFAYIVAGGIARVLESKATVENGIRSGTVTVSDDEGEGHDIDAGGKRKRNEGPEEASVDQRRLYGDDVDDVDVLGSGKGWKKIRETQKTHPPRAPTLILPKPIHRAPMPEVPALSAALSPTFASVAATIQSIASRLEKFSAASAAGFVGHPGAMGMALSPAGSGLLGVGAWWEHETGVWMEKTSGGERGKDRSKDKDRENRSADASRSRVKDPLRESSKFFEELEWQTQAVKDVLGLVKLADRTRRDVGE